ncbi:Delta(14)-sterol reductase, partial [Neolecta irregularis DAH-3]
KAEISYNIAPELKTQTSFFAFVVIGRNASVAFNNTSVMLNPPTSHYEFLGPPGALLTSFGVCIVSFALFFLCTEDGCPPKELEIKWNKFWSWKITGLYLVWWILLLAMTIIVPGNYVQGTKLRDGKNLSYKMNGFRIFILVYSITLAIAYKSPSTLAYLADNFLPLISVTSLFSFLLAVFVYFRSYKSSAMLALGGNSSSGIYNWFIGRELNPRISILNLHDLDLKEWCELRPGLILWTILNLSFAMKQYVSLGYVQLSMILVNIFQFMYVWDSLYNEPAVLTTMDITTDGFGFMLSFGDLSWVPTTYSLQARYLSLFPRDFSTKMMAMVIVTQIVGYYIFRSSNSQKNEFRKDPNASTVKHLKFLETKAGSLLLISGWWGTARHINYLGDWIMACSWCLTTGFNTPITYFYVVYFAV